MRTCCIALMALLARNACAGAVTNLYSAQFSAAEGYNPNYELIGQQGWIGYPAVSGGNGLVTNFVGTQAAYVGLFPLNPRQDYLSVWQPLNYSPALSNHPVITFSVMMDIEDSTNGRRDDFFWSAYNTRGERLFTLDFFNEDLGIYYALDGTNQLVYTGLTFTNATAYNLTVTMDLAANAWSATLSGRLLVTNLPLTTTNALRDLGDIDATWAVFNLSKPGNNFMVFDNYQVTATFSVPSPATLQVLGRTLDGKFLVRVSAASGARYAVEAGTNLVQWTALKTNVVTDGYFDYTDTAAASFPRRFYRARLVP